MNNLIIGRSNKPFDEYLSQDHIKAGTTLVNEIKYRPVIYNEQPTRYKVSNTGNVLSLCGNRPRILTGRISYDGYHDVVLRIAGQPKSFRVHRLVAQSFIPNPDNLATVNHIDGNKLNNAVSNLQWMSQSDNMQHAFATGLCNISGESNGRAKLSAPQVQEIRKQLASGRPQKDIAAEFDVVMQTISKIKNGQCWKDVRTAA